MRRPGRRTVAIVMATVALSAAGCSSTEGGGAGSLPTALPRQPSPTSAPSGREAAPSTPDSPVGANATVVRVVDGDTLVLSIGGRNEKSRLIGINSPESVDPRRPVECFGKEASRHLEELLPRGTAVRAERDAEARDRYGRLLTYVYRAADGLFVNLAQVRDGFAQVYTFPPNVAHVEEFRAAEAAARQAGAGLWSSCPTNR